MFNFKKNAVASIMILGMAATANAAETTTETTTETTASTPGAFATLVWTGTVPNSQASSGLIITGLDSNLTGFNGVVVADVDGTFETESIVLEAHKNDAAEGASPVVGELTNANWTVTGYDVKYDNKAPSKSNIEVYLNDQLTALNASVSDVNTVKARLKQTEELTAEEVGGTSVQATLTLMADAA